MQRLDIKIIKEAKENKLKNLEEEMREVVLGFKGSNPFPCPFCHYESKKNRKGSALIFEDNGSDVFLCLSCRKWRKVK